MNEKEIHDVDRDARKAAAARGNRSPGKEAMVESYVRAVLYGVVSGVTKRDSHAGGAA
jgi:hypothetical protein